MNAIEVKNLKKYFHKVKAIDGISFEVSEGEIFGFLGPNGAGKTTAIRCMMDFLRPTKGSIKILGLDSKKDSVEIHKITGHLSGDIKLYESWTGEDHINLVAKMKGDGDYADELSKRLDFDPKMKVYYLSTGNKQKLGLILTLMSKPKILILDEPTVGLDPILQNEIYKVLKELKKDGTTIFMSSHNLTEVEKFCERVGIIKSGKIVAVEDIETLKQKAIYEVTVYFDQKISPDDFKLAGIQNIQQIHETGLTFDVKHDINPILQKLSGYNLKDIKIARASLDEIFLEYYSNE
jgi:ABC-2 type transport system ATP-binding protein